MSLTLHSVCGNFRGNAILTTADYAKVPVQANYMQWSEIKSKENVERNSMGQVPTLQTPQGNITQIMACLRYIGSVATQGNIYGANEFQKAQVDQWIDFVQLELFPSCLQSLCLQLWQFGNPTEEQAKTNYTNIERFFPYLESHLAGKQFLVGNGATLADFALYSHLVHPYRCIFTEQQRAKYPNILKWFETQAQNQSNIKFFGKHRYSTAPWI